MNKKIWVGFYVASFLLLLLASLIAGTVLLLQMDQAAEFSYQTLSLVTALGVLGYLQFVVVQTVYNFVILAKMWGSIQDGQTPISTGKAIGYLFIPFFNIYWLFVAWGGFPTHYNNFIERHGLNAPRLTGGVFTLLPLMILLTGILVVPILLMPLVFSFVIARTCDAVNELKAATMEKQTGVVNPARREPKPKSKLVPATIAAAVVVPLFLFFAFAVFAARNMNPRASDTELPETVGKLKRHYPSTYGSIFGLRSEYTASYKLPDEKTHSDYISYRMIDFRREADAGQRLKRWSYCSGAARKEGAIKDKNGNQIGESVLCDGKRFYSKIKNRYVSVDSAGSKFGLNDVIEFYTKLPFNQNVDAADLTASLKGISLQTNSKSSDSQINNASADGKADIAITAEEFFKDTGGYGSSKNREKYAGKIIEVTGVVKQIGNDKHFLEVGDTKWVTCKPDEENAGQFNALTAGQEIKFKGIGSESSGWLEHCLVAS